MTRINKMRFMIANDMVPELTRRLRSLKHITSNNFGVTGGTGNVRRVQAATSQRRLIRSSSFSLFVIIVWPAMRSPIALASTLTRCGSTNASQRQTSSTAFKIKTVTIWRRSTEPVRAGLCAVETDFTAAGSGVRGDGSASHMSTLSASRPASTD